MNLALGVDVGATKTNLGIISLADGRPLEVVQIPTEIGRGSIAFADRLVAQVGVLRQRQEADYLGLAIPELITLDHRPASAYLWDWDQLDLEARLGPLVFESDVVAAARAEARYGPFRGSTFLYVSLGTGLSSCLVIDGEVYRGNRGFAIHCGHTPVSVPGLTKGIVLEELVSGPGLLRSVQERVPGLCSTTAEVFEQCRLGQPVARRVVNEAAALLGSWLGQLVNTLDPRAVVLGGGLGSVTAYSAAIESHLRRAVWTPLARDLPISPACFGTQNGMVGAALPLD